MAAPKIMTCTCCGADITAPQFFQGKPYGWTCIKKVNPAAKQSKVKFVAVELVKFVSKLTKEEITAAVLADGKFPYGTNGVVLVNGKKVAFPATATNTFVQNGNVFVSEKEYAILDDQTSDVPAWMRGQVSTLAM
jgi:hypothetical protein